MNGQVVVFPERRVDGEVWEAWIDEVAVARHFGVSARTVRRWRREGMPSRKWGAARRFRLSACERWLEAHHSEETAR